MRTRCIGHAALEIEASGLRLLTDPWWAGPAYTNQWHAWPTPQPAGVESRQLDYVYLSHGHEDHLHADSLRQLRPGAAALLPEFLTGSAADFLTKELRFCQVIPLRHGRTVELRRGLRATCYVNLTDSMLVLEDGDRVLVNANDALHASPPAVIDHFCRLLRRNHATVDTLYLGFSGASWFPNCVRVPGKQDRNVARAREELFCDNFLRVVDQLRPRVACAFAASFALVDPQLRWINEVKLDVPTPDLAYAHTHPAGSSRVHLLLPNDVVDGLDITRGTTPRPSLAELEHAYSGVLREAAEHNAKLKPLNSMELLDLVTRLGDRLKANRHRLVTPVPFSAEIRLRDNPGTALHIEMDARGARAVLGAHNGSDASIEMRAEILNAALNSDYGIESVFIGYGATVNLRKPEHFGRVQTLLSALSPRESRLGAFAKEIRRRPLSFVSDAWNQRWPLALSAAARLGALPHPYELRNLGVLEEESVSKAA